LGSREPWVRGFSPLHPAESFHPNLTGMQAVADAIAEHLAADR
jgi:lysophospholipase L1-like esterase